VGAADVAEREDEHREHEADRDGGQVPQGVERAADFDEVAVAGVGEEGSEREDERADPFHEELHVRGLQPHKGQTEHRHSLESVVAKSSSQ